MIKNRSENELISGPLNGVEGVQCQNDKSLKKYFIPACCYPCYAITIIIIQKINKNGEVTVFLSQTEIYKS